MDSYGKQHERHSMLAVNSGAADGSRGVTSGKTSKDYKPTAIRWPTLVFFALVLAGCVGMIELLFGITKPTPESQTQNQARSVNTSPNHLVPRADGDCTKLPALSASLSSINQAMTSVCAVYTQSYQGKTLNGTQTAAFERWQGTASQQHELRGQVYRAMTAANDDCYEYRETTMAGYIPLPTPTSTYYQTCSTIISPTHCQGEVVRIVMISKVVTETTETAFCTIASDKLLVFKTKPKGTESTVFKTTDRQLDPGATATIGSNPKSSPINREPTTSPTIITSKITAVSVIVTTDRAGIVTSQTSTYIQETLVSTNVRVSPGSNTASHTRGDIIPTSFNPPDVTSFIFGDSERYVDRPFTMENYVAAVYLPAIIAVFLKVIWEAIHSAYKLVEPFHRLSKKGGSSATNSLFAQYLSASVSWDALGSCFRGHALAAVTTIVYFALMLLASLSSSAMTVRGSDLCEGEGGRTVTCTPLWLIQGNILRVVEGLLILCFILVAAIAVMSKWYKTGLSASPSSIASVATLVNQDALVRAFRSTDPSASDASLAKAIQGERCWLGYHQHNVRGSLYGIGCQVNPVASPSTINQPVAGWHNGYTMVANPALPPPRGGKSRTAWLLFLNIVQLISSMAAFGVVVAYYRDGTDSAFNRFFNSDTWYSQAVFVNCAVIVDMQWKRLEREVRITEPYRRMAKGFAPPETTVLLHVHGSCWSSFFQAATKMFRYKDMWFQALVAFVAVLSDFNIIAFASVVYNSAQTSTSLKIAGFTAMSITGLMVIVMLITMFWWSKGIVTRMPRTPDTVGTVYSYLCGSRFAQELGSAKLENMPQKARDEMIIATGWQFSFRWRPGVDGVERWTVDFEKP